MGSSPGKTDERTRPFTVGLLTLVIVAAVFGWVWLQSDKYKPLVVGHPVPDIVLNDITGKEHRLADYRGKVVFLNFWATWCKPCQEEMPSMEVLYRNLKDKDFEILAVSMDRVTSQGDVVPFSRNLNLTFPILLDPWGKTDGKYKLTGFPETYIIDREGRLAEKVIGPRDWTDMNNIQTIVGLLNALPKPQPAS